MANLRQFSKGEDIKITITPDSGVTISVSEAKVVVYPDSLDLSNESSSSSKIKEYGLTLSNSVYTATIPKADTSSDNMPAGDYTIELKYGSSEVSIVRQNHAFTLVESGYNVKNPQ